MKKLFLVLSIILLAVGITTAQKSQVPYIKNGDVYIGTTKIYDVNNASGVESVTINNKPFLYYWTNDGRIWCIKLNSDGKPSTRFELDCGPDRVTNVVSTGDSGAIFTSNKGKRYRIKFQSSGKCRSSSQI